MKKTLQSQENDIHGQDDHDQSQLNVSPMFEDGEYMSNRITNTHMASVLLIDAADDVIERLDSHVKRVVEYDLSVGAALHIDIRHASCDQSMLEGKE
jgi:hypothetical protein